MKIKRLRENAILLVGENPETDWCEVPYWPCEDADLAVGTCYRASAQFKAELKAALLDYEEEDDEKANS